MILLGLGTLLAQPKNDPQAMIAANAAKLEYPSGKKLEERVGGRLYQSIVATVDDLVKVDEWNAKQFIIGPRPVAGIKIDGDGSRQSIFQDGQRLDVKGLEQRPISVRSYVIKDKKRTVVVVISRPPGEQKTVISLTYMPE